MYRDRVQVSRANRYRAWSTLLGASWRARPGSGGPCSRPFDQLDGSPPRNCSSGEKSSAPHPHQSRLDLLLVRIAGHLVLEALGAIFLKSIGDNRTRNDHGQHAHACRGVNNSTRQGCPGGFLLLRHGIPLIIRKREISQPRKKHADGNVVRSVHPRPSIGQPFQPRQKTPRKSPFQPRDARRREW